MKKVYFQETQRFSQWWIWLIFIICIGFSLFPIYDSIQQNQAISSDQWFGIAVLVIVIVFFLMIKLDTSLKEDGIYIRFFPFIWKERFIPWSQITSAEVRKYSAMKEFGGWGYRINSKGNAYNVSGNQGLQLRYNEKNLLIGTRKPDELQQALNQIKNLHL